MYASTSIAIGILRLALLWLFLFYCHKRSVRHVYDLDIINFIVSRWFKYGSVTVLIIFALVAFNCYDVFNIILILSFYILFDTYQFRGVKHIYKNLASKVKKALLFVLKYIELKKPLKFWLRISSKKSEKKIALKSSLALSVISVLIFVFRSSLLKYDKYLLTELWLEDLRKIISYNYHDAFQNLAIVEGEYLLINFYSKLVSINPEAALAAFGILQSISLTIIIIWAINKIGQIGYVIPSIGALIFGMILLITPIDLHYITQHQSVFLALTFAIPLMVYISKPQRKTTPIRLFVLQTCIALLTIGLIDVFVLLIIFPPFLICNFLYVKKLQMVYRSLPILALAIVLGIIYSLYSLIDPTFEVIYFLKINLIAVSSFTYVPHLIIPYNALTNYVCVISIISILISTGLPTFKDEINRSGAVILYYYLSLIILTQLNIFLIDTDLLYKAMSVITPLVIGVNIIIISKFILYIIKAQVIIYKYILSSALLLLIFGCFMFSQQQSVVLMSKTSDYPKELLMIYDKIAADFLPYTYAVVNSSNTQILSIHKHFFINYDDFNTSYLNKDSIYHLHKSDKEILKKHPEYILPQTVLYFKKKIKTDSLSDEFIKSVKLLNELCNRGRAISKIYESEHIEVLEIVNSPKSSKVVDLILKSR